jgi:hypothetical protein
VWQLVIGALNLCPWVNLSFPVLPWPFSVLPCPLFVACCANLCVAPPSANLSRTSFIASCIASLPPPPHTHPHTHTHTHTPLFVASFIAYRVGNGSTYDQTEPMGGSTTNDRIPRHLEADGARDGTAGEPDLYGVARLSVFIYVF